MKKWCITKLRTLSIIDGLYHDPYCFNNFLVSGKHNFFKPKFSPKFCRIEISELIVLLQFKLYNTILK